MRKFTFDNRLLVGIEICGEFLERRRHEAEGIDESTSHLTAHDMFGEGDISFHGKWQQVDASIHASRNLLDDDVTVVFAQVVKDDGDGGRVLIVEAALFMRSATESAGQMAMISNTYSAIQRLLTYVAVARITEGFFLLWCKIYTFLIFVQCSPLAQPTLRVLEKTTVQDRFLGNCCSVRDCCRSCTWRSILHCRVLGFGWFVYSHWSIQISIEYT